MYNPIYCQFMHIEGIERIHINATELSTDITDFLRLTVIYLCLLFHSRMLYFLISKKWYVCTSNNRNIKEIVE